MSLGHTLVQPNTDKQVILDNLCLKIDFGNYDDYRARELINSKTELSLLLASKFLEKIRSSAHNKSSERLQDEIAIEGFLFFMIGAADGLYQEINKKLCTLKEPKVNNDSILKCLGNNSDAISAQIKTIIEKATTEPKWTVTEIQDQDPVTWPCDWDRGESWLWEIGALRNKITHRSATNQAISAGDSAVEASLIVTQLFFTQVYTKWADGSTSVRDIGGTGKETITESDPHAYCMDRFQKLEGMISDIRGHLANAN